MPNPGVSNSASINLLPVQAQYDANNNCTALIGQGGNTLVAPINASSLSLNGNLLSSGVAPTLGSGWGTNPALVANNTTAFKITVGTGGASSGTINFPTAPNGWIVYAADVTSGTSLFLQQTGSTATSATLTSYGITTGTASPMLAGDSILITAFAY
jgi:hypothetical protein